jgi:hypothetical protein
MNIVAWCFQVSVRLPYSEYQHIPAIEVQLTVVANLIIDPADIYLLKGDSVQYRILQVSSVSVFIFYKLTYSIFLRNELHKGLMWICLCLHLFLNELITTAVPENKFL